MVRRGISFLFMVIWLAAGFSAQSGAQSIERGPYLQSGAPTSVIVKWRTDVPSDSRVSYGTSVGNLNNNSDDAALVTDHAVLLSGLQADTRYYYSIGTTGGSLAGAGDSTYSFVTAPLPDTPKPTRVWVIGDSGTANANAAAVRDAYKGFSGSTATDLWLMLGDNAYPDGTDSEYQGAVFDMYPEILRQTVLWPTLGNHDGHTADSGTQTGPYYDIFTLPAGAEAGGLASGTEAYYSFDYGNIHFICLDSYDSSRSPGGAMLTWLEQDLMQTDKDWIIAFWHHPPYTKGSHNSDTEGRLIDMRQNALPILESYGVDLVMTGHSHSYERSVLLDGHYGSSGSLTGQMVLDGGSGREDEPDGAYAKPESGAPNAGAIYAVAGSSGKISGGTLDHPAMFVSLNSLGSMVLDFAGNRLDVKFIDQNGSVLDYFTLLKTPDTDPPQLVAADAGSPTEVTISYSEPVEQTSAETAGNYAIDQGVTVSAAALALNGRDVVLTVSPLVEGVEHTLTVSNVTDTAGNSIAAGSQTAFSFVNLIDKDFQDGVAPDAAYSGTRDTEINQAQATANFGTASVLRADGDDPGGSGQDVSSLIKWDLSEIPANAIVEAASITFMVSDASSQSYVLYELLRNWQEGEATWQVWSNGNAWQTAGALGTADQGSTMLGQINAGVTGLTSVPLNAAGVAVVQGWVDGSAPNYGFHLVENGATNGLDLRSSEYGTPGERPKLTVTYSLPTGGGDTEAPSTPQGLAAADVTDTTVAFSWQPATDNVAVTGYKVLRGGVQIGTTAATSYLDSGLSPGTPYSYSVIAFDAANNESFESDPLDVTTDPAVTPTVHVEDVVVQRVLSGKKWQNATAQVTVLDHNAQPVANAEVTGSWSGLTSDTQSAATLSDGTAQFTSPKVNQNATGQFAFDVSGVAASGFLYDSSANVETGDCIDTNDMACGGSGEPIVMTVSQIQVSLLSQGSRWRGEASVTVVDELGQPVPGAVVSGDWLLSPDGTGLGSDSAMTDAAGVALLESSKIRAGSGDIFEITLTGVQRDGDSYLPGVTFGSAAVP